jgi:hypothetical protein
LLISFNISSLDLVPKSSVNYSLPGEYTFTGQNPGYITDSAYLINDGKDNGMQKFNVMINTPGIHYIVVRDVSTDSISFLSKIPFKNSSFYSNPIVAFEDGSSETKIFWGDIHTHSHLSDAAGSVAHNIKYARDIANLDFFSITDHSEIMTFTPWVFPSLESEINKANKPGTFVAFQGIEYTNVEYGHYTLIMDGEDLLYPPDLLPGRYGSISNPQRLWADLDAFTARTGSRVLALPHHTTKKYYPQDWSYINPKYVRIAEVTSTHGEFLYEHRHPLNYHGADSPPKEYTYGTSITDALKMGLSLSLYASSDGHCGHPGHTIAHTGAGVAHQRPLTTWHTRVDKVWPSGLTAVYTTNLTRFSVFDALYNRQIYGTSDFGRPYLYFSINNATVGGNSTIFVSNSTINRELKIFIAQDGSPAAARERSAASLVSENWLPMWNGTVEILKNGELLSSIQISTPIASIAINDNNTITGTAYDQCIQKNGKYYLNNFSENPVNPTELNTNGKDFYIVRLVGQNRRFAYIGPIWVGVT